MFYYVLSLFYLSKNPHLVTVYLTTANCISIVMDYIIYGLGNNEKRYLLTKHNIGRIFVEECANILGLNFKEGNLLSSKLYYTKLNDGEDFYHFLYSADYMNTSGKQLQAYLRYFKIENVVVCIVQDDSDIFIQNHKFVKGGGTGGHNGIKSINTELSSIQETNLRLKIGIRPFDCKLKSETFVLTAFNEAEKKYCHNLAKCFVGNLGEYGKNPSKFSTIINGWKGC